jgi:transcription elongation factor GreA
MTITEKCIDMRLRGYPESDPWQNAIPGTAACPPDTANSAIVVGVPCGFMTESHLSPQAYERLQQELDERTKTRRREISLWIERAREHGDISENADYDAAKNEQGHNEARIRQLEAMLKSAVVLEGGTSGEVVEPGCLVDLRYEGDDDVTTYLVGSIEERHDTYDVLSMNSPLGQAILGKSAGDAVTYKGPKRELSVTVVGLRPLA